MGVTALIMAGGKGSRMKIPQEKPMIKVHDKPVIEYVLSALKNAKKIDSIVVAVSSNTPKTAELLANYPVKVIQTPGKDHVFDMGYAVEQLKLETVLIIAADLPLITGEILDSILEYYEQCGKPALSVVVPVQTKERLGMSIDYAYKIDDKQVVPAGINIIDGRKRSSDEWLEQSDYLLDLDEVAVNINTIEELQVAERLMSNKLPKLNENKKKLLTYNKKNLILKNKK